MAALTHEFTGSINGSWGEPRNWNTGVLPGFGGIGLDTALVPAGIAQALTSNLDRTVDGVHATETLTLTGQPLNTETVTINTNVYTFQTVLTDTDGNVLIGATASASLDNLIAAMNLGPGAGTTYALSTTLHATVTAEATAGDTMLATARISGTGPNAFDTTETLTNGSWGAATLSGGTADVGLHLALLHVQEGAPPIGASGNELKLTAEKIIARGDLDGSFYFETATGTGSENTERLIIESDSNDIVISGDGTAAIEKCDITRGGVTLAVQDGDAAYAINHLYVAYETDPLLDVNLTIGAATGQIASMLVAGGSTVTSSNDHALAVIRAGEIHFDASSGWRGGTGKLYQTGGKCQYDVPTKAGLNPSYTILEEAHIIGGVFDVSQTVPLKKINLLFVAPGATLIGDNDQLTTDPVFVGVP